MLERYNIKDLFLATIEVTCSEDKEQILGFCSYKYYTAILKKDGDKYIDLNNPSRNLQSTRTKNENGYKICHVDPLSEHIENKETISVEETKKEIKEYDAKQLRKRKEDYYDFFDFY